MLPQDKTPVLDDPRLQSRFNDVIDACQHSEASASPLSPLPAHFKNALLTDTDWVQLNAHADAAQSIHRQNGFQRVLHYFLKPLLARHNPFNTAVKNVLFTVRPMLVHFADNDLKYYHSLSQLHEKMDFLIQENQRLSETVRQLQAAALDKAN